MYKYLSFSRNDVLRVQRAFLYALHKPHLKRNLGAKRRPKRRKMKGKARQGEGREDRGGLRRKGEGRRREVALLFLGGF